ncbi:hypothetical protein [Pseudomonas sp. PS01301]|uniref:hypothetical protein n=1 Tax=Pseudomonas sp. PS01301 TaxID=2991437 RepID=UPI00249BC4D5|nr:hypothetical protein [Pseudomonas sp. PS01301]
MEELVYTSICQNNGLIIFDALGESEMQTGLRLYEDLLDHSTAIGRAGYCSFHKIKSKQMLIAALRMVQTECRSGVLFPVLHFECHGDPAKGIFLHASNEYVGWEELVQEIAAINQATRNNTAVVLAVCHGLEISKLVSITAPCPFNYLIAAPDEVQAGYLRDVIPAFYKSVVQSGDLQAGLALLAAPLKLFHCGEWFYRTLATFMVTSFNAAGRAEVVEQIVTDQVEKAGYRNREMIRAARARAKAYVKSPHGFYNQASSIFFHGKLPIPYGDFRAFVEVKRHCR